MQLLIVIAPALCYADRVFESDGRSATRRRSGDELIMSLGQALETEDCSNLSTLSHPTQVDLVFGGITYVWEPLVRMLPIRPSRCREPELAPLLDSPLAEGWL